MGSDIGEDLDCDRSGESRMNDILVPILAIGIVIVPLIVVLGYSEITRWRADKKAEKQFAQEQIKFKQRMKR